MFNFLLLADIGKYPDTLAVRHNYVPSIGIWAIDSYWTTVAYVLVFLLLKHMEWKLTPAKPIMLKGHY